MVSVIYIFLEILKIFYFILLYCQNYVDILKIHKIIKKF